MLYFIYYYTQNTIYYIILYYYILGWTKSRPIPHITLLGRRFCRWRPGVQEPSIKFNPPTRYKSRTVFSSLERKPSQGGPNRFSWVTDLGHRSNDYVWEKEGPTTNKSYLFWRVDIQWSTFVSTTPTPPIETHTDGHSLCLRNNRHKILLLVYVSWSLMSTEIEKVVPQKPLNSEFLSRSSRNL